MPDLKFLYRVLYIAFLNKLLIFKKKRLLSRRPQVITNQKDHRWTFLDTWKTLKYLNINDSFHLKELEISKYTNLYNNSVVEKINGMAYIFTLLMFRKLNKRTINKNKTTHFYRSTSFRFSFIFRYFKFFQMKRIVYI
jgi:hypothetical protein